MGYTARAIRLLILVLLMAVPAQALNLGQLRTQLNAYLDDASNLMIASARKDSIINAAMREMAGQFPVYVDTARLELVSGTRLYSLPAGYAGRVISVHKTDEMFTEVKRIPSDSIPELQLGTVRFFSTVHNFLIMHPEPVIDDDSVFYFYAALPTAMTGDASDCVLLDQYEEALLMFAASKCWLTADMRPDMAQMFYSRYLESMSIFTQKQITRPAQ